MKRIAVAILFLFSSIVTHAQFLEKHGMMYNNNSFDVIIFKVDSSLCNGFKIVDNSNGLSESDFFDQLSVSSTGSFFAVNAGSADDNCNPLGLLINQSNTLQNINTANSGQGNFYLQPNGFIGFTSSDLIINQTKKFNAAQALITAIQNGPMLIYDFKINENFNSSSSNLNIRVGAGTFTNSNGKFLVFALSNNPVNFYQFASFFLEKFNCGQAINLEGGDRCSMHLPTYKKTPGTSKSICKYLVIHP